MSDAQLDALTRRAHAKIHPALSLAPPEPAGGPRAGWHRICTWIHAIELADTVTLSRGGPGSGVTLNLTRAPDAPVAFAIDWPAEKDLAVRGVRALAAHTGLSIDAKIDIVKRVPPQAGLGGGSSDAASALLLANELFGLGLSRDALREVALTLGSDVPFFLDDGDDRDPARPAIVSGFGETIERTERAAAAITLAVPAFGCPTPEVYAAFDALGPAAIEPARVEALARSGGRDGGALFNDLAPAAERVRPELAGVRAVMADACGTPAHITGSGSAVFVVGDFADEARAALSEASRQGVAVFRSKLV